MTVRESIMGHINMFVDNNVERDSKSHRLFAMMLTEMMARMDDGDERDPYDLNVEHESAFEVMRVINAGYAFACVCDPTPAILMPLIESINHACFSIVNE